MAYVGTHAGRFVGVVAAGEGAGQTMLDLSLGGMVWSTAAVMDGKVYVGADDDTLYAIDTARGDFAWTLRLGNCVPARAPGPEGTRCDVDGGPVLAEDGDLFVGADGLYRVSPEGVVRWHFVHQDEARARHVFSRPLVTPAGLVVFGGQDGSITAVAAEDGALVWRHVVRADVDGSPVLGLDGSIYVGADDGRLYALRSDGTIAWDFATAGELRNAAAVGPEGSVFVASFDGGLYHLDAYGRVLWKLATGEPIAASPIVDAQGLVIVGGQDDRLYAVDRDGHVRWNLQFPGDIDSTVSITEDGTLVVGCDDGHLRGLR